MNALTGNFEKNLPSKKTAVTSDNPLLAAAAESHRSRNDSQLIYSALED